MGKAAPAPGNYTGAAGQQADSSQAAVDRQARANRPNINGVGGSQEWQQGPDGQWTLNQGYGQNEGLAQMLRGQSQEALGQPLRDGEQVRQSTIDSAYGAARSRLDPQWAQADQLRQSGLSNQGIDPNSAAGRGANMQFQQGRNDAYGQAMAGAVREGNAAASDVFRNNMAARNNPMAQLMALAGGTQTPQFNSAGMGETPQWLAALMGQDRANLGAWDATNRANADAWNGAFNGISAVGGLAGKAFGF